MSSSGYPQVEFEYEEGSGTDDDDETDEDSTRPDNQIINGGGHEGNNLALRRTRSSSRFQRSFKTIL